MLGSKKHAIAPPPALAACIAASARSSGFAGPSASGWQAMPIEPETTTSRPPIRHGRLIAASSRLDSTASSSAWGLPRTQHQELVAARMREQVLRSRLAAQPGRDDAQQAIAGVVAERLVDRPEAIETDEEHGEAAGLAADALHRFGESALEHQAVRQPGEGIAERLALQLAFGVAQRSAQARLERRAEPRRQQQRDRTDRGQPRQHGRRHAVREQRVALRRQAGGVQQQVLAEHDRETEDHRADRRPVRHRPAPSAHAQGEGEGEHRAPRTDDRRAGERREAPVDARADAECEQRDRLDARQARAESAGGQQQPRPARHARAQRSEPAQADDHGEQPDRQHRAGVVAEGVGQRRRRRQRRGRAPTRGRCRVRARRPRASAGRPGASTRRMRRARSRATWLASTAMPALSTSEGCPGEFRRVSRGSSARRSGSAAPAPMRAGQQEGRRHPEAIGAPPGGLSEI